MIDIHTDLIGSLVSVEPDNGNVNVNSSNANFPNLGGNYNNADNAGLFNCNVNNNSTNSNSNYGSRLAQYHAPSQAWEKMEKKSNVPWLLPKQKPSNRIRYVGTPE